MNTASRPPVHAAAAPSDAVVPKRASERAASAVTVTGLIFANACSQCGMVATGTNTELAKMSGKITTNPAVCAASAPRDGERHEGEDPAEGEAEGGGDGGAGDRSGHPAVEAEPDQVPDGDHQPDDEDVADQVGHGAPGQHRGAGHRHGPEP